MRKNKLFLSLEEDKGPSDNDLIIDKILDKKEEEESPLSLTADLLKQREQIKKEVEEVIKDDEEPEEDDSEESSEETEGDSEGESGSEEEGNKEGGEESSDSGDSDDSGDEPKKEEKDEDDEGAVADNEEDLDNLIGSGLEEATESFSVKKPEPVSKPVKQVFSKNIFEPLRKAHSRYLISLEELGVEGGKVNETEQPVVYVKEEILTSINNLTNIAKSYIDNTKAFNSKIGESLSNLSERITVFSKLVEGGRYHFTHKLVLDRDILANVGYEGTTDIRDTVKALKSYIEVSAKASSLLLNNPFEELASSFLTEGFEEVEGELVYKKGIPGFTVVKLSRVPYVDYMKTKVDEFNYYKLKLMKTEELYKLPSISLTDDKDLLYTVESLQSLIVDSSVSVDTLSGIVDNFVKFIDELKVLAYNVENDEYDKLTDLGLDDKIKDFIKFKLVMEIAFVNINLMIDYLTSIMSALNIVVELKDEEPASVSS